jgi:hypothetical protein
MIQNIFVGLLIVIVVGAGIWAWCLENRTTKENIPEKETITQEKETNKED